VTAAEHLERDGQHQQICDVRYYDISWRRLYVLLSRMQHTLSCLSVVGKQWEPVSHCQHFSLVNINMKLQRDWLIVAVNIWMYEQ